MRLCLLLTSLFLACCSVYAAESGFSMPVATPEQKMPRQVRLQLEIEENDIKDYGLQASALQTEITTRLSLGQIQVKDDPSLPLLLLRIKSIQADRAIASFVQLVFFEDAILKRNRMEFMAMTWSKATLISGPKEDLTKELTQAVVSMVNTFILDYHKAMAPAAT